MIFLTNLRPYILGAPSDRLAGALPESAVSAAPPRPVGFAWLHYVMFAGFLAFAIASACFEVRKSGANGASGDPGAGGGDKSRSGGTTALIRLPKVPSHADLVDPVVFTGPPCAERPTETPRTWSRQLSAKAFGDIAHATVTFYSEYPGDEVRLDEARLLAGGAGWITRKPEGFSVFDIALQAGASTAVVAATLSNGPCVPSAHVRATVHASRVDKEGQMPVLLELVPPAL